MEDGSRDQKNTDIGVLLREQSQGLVQETPLPLGQGPSSVCPGKLKTASHFFHPLNESVYCCFCTSLPPL